MGYVGLPLAVELGTVLETIGYDIKQDRINDGMGAYVARQVIKLMIRRGHRVEGSHVLILGITFKENCPDIRNSRIIDIIHELHEYGCRVEVHDPWAEAAEVKAEYNLDITTDPHGQYDAVILAVAHREFMDMKLDHLINEHTVTYDVKGIVNREQVTGRL